MINLPFSTPNRWRTIFSTTSVSLHCAARLAIAAHASSLVTVSLEFIWAKKKQKKKQWVQFKDQPKFENIVEEILFPLIHIGQRPDMVYLPPRGNFVDHDFLEASCLASFLQHVSPLAMEALPSNSPLHMLPIQRHKFNIKRTEVRIHVNICRCSIKSYFI